MIEAICTTFLNINSKFARRIVLILILMFIVETPIDPQKASEEPLIDKQTIDFLKNFKLKINRLHVRYEDDYFTGESPFSFGVVLDVNLFHFMD